MSGRVGRQSQMMAAIGSFAIANSNIRLLNNCLLQMEHGMAMDGSLLMSAEVEKYMLIGHCH